MQKQIQKTNRKIKKHLNSFVNRVVFAFKVLLVVFILFLVVLIFITKPNRSVDRTVSSNQEETIQAEIISREDFLDTIIPVAQTAQVEYGVRPSVLVAQAALESNWGNSGLSKASNNYFGIKASSQGERYATREFNEDEWVNIEASFREYDSLEASVNDYANLLRNGTSWDADLYQDVLTATHYKDASLALQEAGYATDPNYADKLIQIIEQYELDELDD